MSVNILAIKVSDGECVIDPATLSRSNAANVCAGMDLIATLHKGNVPFPQTIQVVTTYSLQRRLWIDALFQFSIQQNLEMTMLPSVLASNSMQGREADFIIFDSVLSVANGLGDLFLPKTQS